MGLEIIWRFMWKKHLFDCWIFFRLDRCTETIQTPTWSQTRCQFTDRSHGLTSYACRSCRLVVLTFSSTSSQKHTLLDLNFVNCSRFFLFHSTNMWFLKTLFLRVFCVLGLRMGVLRWLRELDVLQERHTKLFQIKKTCRTLQCSSSGSHSLKTRLWTSWY